MSDNEKLRRQQTPKVGAMPSSPRLRRLVRAGLAWVAALVAACGIPAGGDTRRPVYVDSVFPIEEEIRRFRATLEEEPTSLRDGAESREELVRRLVDALERTDTLALAGLVLTRAEFGVLYYPHTKYLAQPYTLSPALLWFLIQNESSRGITRALRRYGGRPLRYLGHRCDPEEPEVQGPNRIWTGCVVIFTGPDGKPVEEQLFGSILERQGRYKFISFSNSL